MTKRIVGDDVDQAIDAMMDDVNTIVRPLWRHDATMVGRLTRTTSHSRIWISGRPVARSSKANSREVIE